MEQSVNVRREFAESLSDVEEKQLLDALDRSANPLAQYRHVLHANDLVRQWAQFQAAEVETRVRKWAEENHVTPRVAWFRKQHTDSRARHTLQRLAPYLTADEIRELRIPLRAVEAMLTDEKKV